MFPNAFSDPYPTIFLYVIVLVWPSLDARYPVPLLLPFSSRTIEENKIKKSVVEIKTWRSINASTTKGEKKKSLDLMEINLLKIRFIR